MNATTVTIQSDNQITGAAVFADSVVLYLNGNTEGVRLKLAKEGNEEALRLLPLSLKGRRFNEDAIAVMREHGTQRAKERVGLTLSETDHSAIVGLITSGLSVPLSTDPHSRPKHLVWVKGQEMVVVYHRKSKTILTVMPSWWTNNRRLIQKIMAGPQGPAMMERRRRGRLAAKVKGDW